MIKPVRFAVVSRPLTGGPWVLYRDADDSIMAANNHQQAARHACQLAGLFTDTEYRVFDIQEDEVLAYAYVGAE